MDLVTGRRRKRASGRINNGIPVVGGALVECDHLHCVAEVPFAVVFSGVLVNVPDEGVSGTNL